MEAVTVTEREGGRGYSCPPPIPEFTEEKPAEERLPCKRKKKTEEGL
jgi:hypothetical protein